MKLLMRVLQMDFHHDEGPVQHSDLERKRAMIWENKKRNQFVAHIAESVAHNAFPALKKLGLSKSEIPQELREGTPKVVILTESADQAWAMRDFLPQWEIQDTLPISDEAAWYLPLRPRKSPVGRIATLMYAYRYPVSCDILVRATAGTGKVDWCRSARIQLLAHRPTFIIDIADVGHPHHAEDARNRRRDYLEQHLRVQRDTTRSTAG